jgi:HEAT repeat protein
MPRGPFYWVLRGENAMRQATMGLISIVCLSAISGCGVISSDPPAEIERQAIELIPQYAQQTSASLPGSPRIEPFRPPVVPVSPQISRREDRDLPTTAADALARIGAPAVPYVAGMLNDSDPQVRLRAAQILAQIGPDAEPALPLLVARLRDEDAQVRRASARALGQMGPAAAPAIPALVQMAEE